MPCGGAIGVSCEYGVGVTQPGEGIAFSAAVGTTITPTPAAAVRVCRNAVCAAIPFGSFPGSLPLASASAPTFTFGGDGDRVSVSLSDQGGATVVGAKWKWDGSSTGWKNGDLYTFEVLDGAGAVLLRQQKTAKYERYSVPLGSCYGGGGGALQCLRVTPTDVDLPTDAGSGGTPTSTDAGSGMPTSKDGGTAAAVCCPRVPEAPAVLDDTSQDACVALGGADRGGCFETCFRLCHARYVSATDEAGCDIWAPAPVDAGPAAYCGG